MSGGRRVQPPRAGAGAGTSVVARGGAGGGAAAEPGAPPDLDPSVGTAGPSFLIPPAGGSFLGARGRRRAPALAGGGCQDPPGVGAQPRGVPLSLGVAGRGLRHFRGGLGTDSHARPSACGLAWCGAGAPKGEDWGVAAGGRRGGPQPCGVAGGGHSRQPGRAPLPALSGWPRARACVLPAPLLAPGPEALAPGGVRPPQPPRGLMPGAYPQCG